MSDEEIDRLFDLPLSRFVEERNALAKKAAQSGDKGRSNEIKKLQKPSVPAWALNQLARKHEDALREYLDASDRLFRAQVRSMSSGSADPDFRPAQDAQRTALNALVARIGPELEAQGHKDTRAVEERVAATLRSAVLDEAARARLKEGRMVEDLSETGFDALAAQLGSAPPMPKAQAPHATHAPPAPVARAKEQHEAREREKARAAREALKAAEKEAGAAKKSSVEAEREAAAKRHTAEEAKREVNAAKRALERAEAVLAKAVEAAEAAEAEAESRRRAASEAEAAVVRARKLT